MKLFNAILRDEAGATAIEYGLIAALIAVACIGALSTMSGSLQNTFTGVGTALDTAGTDEAGGGGGDEEEVVE